MKKNDSLFTCGYFYEEFHKHLGKIVHQKQMFSKCGKFVGKPLFGDTPICHRVFLSFSRDVAT